MAEGKSNFLSTLLHLARSLAKLDPTPWEKVQTKHKDPFLVFAYVVYAIFAYS